MSVSFACGLVFGASNGSGNCERVLYYVPGHYIGTLPISCTQEQQERLLIPRERPRSPPSYIYIYICVFVCVGWSVSSGKVQSEE